ncbi:hypothetical protein VPH35_000600 [Triticum aestivum]
MVVQMASITLADLCCGRQNQMLCVRVPRLTHFCSSLESGPIKLIHMVIIDVQVLPFFYQCAVVPTSFAGAYLHILQEGIIYKLGYLMVWPLLNILNPATAPGMSLS